MIDIDWRLLFCRWTDRSAHTVCTHVLRMIISDGLPIPGVTWVAVVGHGCCKPTGAITTTIAEYIIFVEVETHDMIFARQALASERAGPTVWFRGL